MCDKSMDIDDDTYKHHDNDNNPINPFYPNSEIDYSNKSYDFSYTIAPTKGRGRKANFSDLRRSKRRKFSTQPYNKAFHIRKDINKMQDHSIKSSNSCIDLSGSKSDSELSKSEVVSEDHLSDSTIQGESLDECNVNNKDVMQLSINPCNSETINTISKSKNIVESSETMDTQGPVFGRKRKNRKTKKKKYDRAGSVNIDSHTKNDPDSKKRNVDSTSCKTDELNNKPKENDNKDDANRSSNEICSDLTHPNVEKKTDLNIERTTESDVIHKPENCQTCQPLIAGPDLCRCDSSNYQENKDPNFDFEHILREEIPDTKQPIEPLPAKKKNRFSLTKVIFDFCSKSIYGYESDEDESDSKSTDDSKPTSNWLFNINSMNFWKNKPQAVKQLDPYPNTSTVTSSNHHESCHSSNGTTKYGNFNNNDNQHGLPRQKQISLLVLYIAFDCNPRKPNFDKCHLKGYHPIICCFGNLKRDGKDAYSFVYDSIINCWINSWKVALVVSNPMEDRELIYFFKKIREVFDSEILDIILLRPSYSYICTKNLGVNVVNYDKEILFSKIMDNVISKAYRRNKYGGNEILFYNKDEPYYEFTNFYRGPVPIQIDDEYWPTTEHFFQAAKFRDKFIRNKIRRAYSAREAFTIARSNDRQKREDWESPTSPDGIIFKERIMRHGLFEKFTQDDKLKHKLLSTGKSKIYEHTENDRYWGDGGKKDGGLNRLGIMLQELRDIIIGSEKYRLVSEYGYNPKWLVPKLRELRQFDDLIVFDD